MEVWKDIFRGGRYRDQSGTVHTFTDTDVREAHSNAVKMLNNGGEAWAPPAIFEHDWTSVPVPVSAMLSIYETDRDRRADTARNCFGHLKAVELRPDPSTGRPVLWGCHYVHDPKDAERWKATRYCSPRIDWNTIDPLGRRYPGACIVHVAATTRPIQIDQKPVMLSAWKAGSRSLMLSKDDAMAKEDLTGTGGDDLTRLKSLLAQAGFPIPDSATDMNSTLVAFEAGIMARNPDGDVGETEPDGDEGDMGDEGDTADGAGGSTTNSVSPAMLSAIPADQRPAVQAGINGLALITNNTRGRLLKRLTRVEAVAVEKGLYTPTKMAALRTRLTSVALSFMPTGSVVKNSAIHELELLENAVRGIANATNTAPKPGKGKAKTQSISLGGFGGAAPNSIDSDMEASIQAAARAAEERVSPRGNAK